MSQITDYLPTKEADLLAWAQNFNTRLTSPAGPYGLLPGQVTGYTALYTTFNTAWTLANENTTRTPSTIQAKNDAKQALINGTNGIRQLVGIIQKNPATTNTQRTDLQITVPDVEPSPIPVPSEAPIVTVKAVTGRTVTVRLQNAADPTKRAKPAGVKGATVFSYVGETAPMNIEDWKFEGNTSRTVFDVEFAATIPSGSTVWVAAYWFNQRLESGPPSSPVSTWIAGGLAAAA